MDLTSSPSSLTVSINSIHLKSFLDNLYYCWKPHIRIFWLLLYKTLWSMAGIAHNCQMRRPFGWGNLDMLWRSQAYYFYILTFHSLSKNKFYPNRLYILFVDEVVYYLVIWGIKKWIFYDQNIFLIKFECIFYICLVVVVTRKHAHSPIMSISTILMKI